MNKQYNSSIKAQKKNLISFKVASTYPYLRYIYQKTFHLRVVNHKYPTDLLLYHVKMASSLSGDKTGFSVVISTIISTNLKKK
jgi:hypothetical protein